jgi:hypothetical protein
MKQEQQQLTMMLCRCSMLTIDSASLPANMLTEKAPW